MAFDPKLQIQLDELWFRLPAGLGLDEEEKARRQGWLLREFQICAKGKFAAEEQGILNGPINADQLRQKALALGTQLPPEFPPHGGADALTTSIIQKWQESRLRCPVVFEARKKKIGEETPWSNVVDQGFIFHDQLQDELPRVFVRDYTGRQSLQASGLAQIVQVGTAQIFNTHWGLASRRGHTANGEITPDSLVKPMKSEMKPTFRVLAALAMVEAEGVFDCVNGYDDACLSAGLFHHTAFPGNKPFTGASEFGAYLSYLASLEKVGKYDFRDYFGTFGLGPTKKWEVSLRDKNLMTFNAPLGFVNSNGVFVEPSSVSDRNWVRTWHSFYRIRHALSSSPAVQRAFWPFARQRLFDVLNVKWGVGAPPGATTLGSVFKSELSFALLMRWHVYRPGHVVRKGLAGEAPAEIIRAAGLATKPLMDWAVADEARLIEAFLTAAAAEPFKTRVSESFRRTLSVMIDWSKPEWNDGASGPSLHRTRNFSLFAGEMPFPAVGAGRPRKAVKPSSRSQSQA